MHKQIHGYVVWFVATLFVIYSFCLNTAAAVFAGPIKTSLNASDFEVSIGMGAFILGFACMQIPAGYLLDKFNPRIVVSSGILLLALGNLSISFAHHIFFFTLANFLQGLGASFAFVAVAVLIAQWFPAKNFPILFGFTQTLSCISAGIIHYYFTLSLLTQTWNEIYIELAVLGMILFILSLLLIRSPPDNKPVANISLGKSLKEVLHNNQILLCSVAAATSFGVLLAYASFWYSLVQEYYWVGNLQATIIGSIIFVGIGIGTPFFGWLSNRIKSRTKVMHTTIVLGVMTLLLGLYLPHFNLDTLSIIKIVSFFIGFFLSGAMLFYTVVNEIATDNTRGVAISVLNTGVFLFNTVMLFLPYLSVTILSKEFFTYLWVLPFFIMISLGLVYFVKESYPVN